jgi:hypothetical protein
MIGRAARATAAAAVRLQWEVQRANVAERARAAAESAQAATEAFLTKRAAVATPTTLETIRREILRDTAARQARERTARMEAARAAARRTQSGVPGGLGQVLRAVEMERLRAVKRPAGAPAGAPARKLRAGTGAGSLTAGKRARIGKGLRASDPRDLEDIIRFAL